MLKVAIKNNGEDKVIQLTYENLHKELKDIPGAELVVVDGWFDALTKTKNNYVCFVEPDCLVSSGYFTSQLGLFQKNPYFRKLAMLSASTAVNNWANKFYGYNIGNNHADGIIPNKDKKSSRPYPVQIGYVPGSIIRISMLTRALESLKASEALTDDFIFLSTALSLAFWQQGDGNRVYINPNATYCTTEDSVNDIGKFQHQGARSLDMFKRESI